MPDFLDAYDVLGVRPGATQEELRAAHRTLVRRHHPDLADADHREEATRRMQQINVAYGLVRNPSARARYDAVRRLRRLESDDAALAVRWEELARGAGRWAGAWMRRDRDRPLSYRAGRALSRWW